MKDHPVIQEIPRVLGVMPETRDKDEIYPYTRFIKVFFCFNVPKCLFEDFNSI